MYLPDTSVLDSSTGSLRNLKVSSDVIEDLLEGKDGELGGMMTRNLAEEFSSSHFSI